MHPLLNYPFDPQMILRKRKSIKRELLADKGTRFVEKKIAILGGSTTHDITEVLELFLLDQGILPVFYESEYNRFQEDALWGNPQLDTFAPDIICIHTSNRNISRFPSIDDNSETVAEILRQQISQFEEIWKTLSEKFHCPIIQNNFELPFYRLLGNKDVTDIHGRVHFITKLNEVFADYAETHRDFYINDIHYLSASYGLEKWTDLQSWYLYKYALAVSAIPFLSFNIANVIKSIFGMNKKALVLDLDQTLWGGTVGEFGPAGIEIGHETAEGEAYFEFQTYISQLKSLGVLLAVNSWNDEKNAVDGLNHPECVLHPEDFLVIKANWTGKEENFAEIAKELNILPESMVFVDDSPGQRASVLSRFPRAGVPEINKVQDTIRILDRSGFFEVTSLTADDASRNRMIRLDQIRSEEAQNFGNYEDFLRALEMRAVIHNFEPLYIERITQLVNKTNQFNLTTKRCTQSELESWMQSPSRICLYGRLIDKYGDNGITTIVSGSIEQDVLKIDLWLMSCRVLKRGLESAMMDELAAHAKEKDVTEIQGFYISTEKNQMTADFYEKMGFTLISRNGKDSSWKMRVADYQPKNTIIKIEQE